MSDRFVSLDLIDPSQFRHLCPSDAENIERIRFRKADIDGWLEKTSRTAAPAEAAS